MVVILLRMIKKLKISDPSYPYLLKNIFDPPETLYINGLLPEGRYFAVVGTRKMTGFGEKITSELTKSLVRAGFVIVSGMALGIDGVAHKSAIEAGGKTVAVLGAGVEFVYPLAHKALYNSIVRHGAVVSERPGTIHVDRAHFPARNRIISGLSEAVLVIEGDLKSGSLITARLALDQGKDVFAVPGSPGTDFLIDQGAKSVFSVNNIIDEIGMSG